VDIGKLSSEGLNRKGMSFFLQSSGPLQGPFTHDSAVLASPWSRRLEGSASIALVEHGRLEALSTAEGLNTAILSRSILPML